MEIPMNASVFCQDQSCGHSILLIVNPVNKQITHMVVVEEKFPNMKRLVSIAEIEKTFADEIRLRCGQEEFSK